jgi:methyl-accepting chemotaxis protein
LATAATRTLTQQSTELAQIVARFTTAAGAIIAQAQAEEARETHRPAPRAPVRKKVATARAEPADGGWEEF